MSINDEIKNELVKIKNLAESAGIVGGLSADEFLFSILFANLFFYNNEITKSDIIDGFVDGSNDGGIDFILYDDNNLYLIQSKTNESITYEIVMSSISKISSTLMDLENKKYNNFNDRLKSSYLNAIESFNQEHETIIYFVSSSNISEDIKSRILTHFNSSEDFNFKVEIVDGIEIVEEIDRYKYSQITVKNGSLKLDKTKNILSYDYSQEGIICNVRASSVKDLYNKEKNKGLFIYNLREHVPSALVDNAIDRTIKNEPEKFWFYNNGITIACEDYRVDGNELKLESFSIINGAQTTTRIGNSNSINATKDFYLVAKIIKTTGPNKNEFMERISEASNSQKPIKFSDLKSNRREQRELQIKAMENKPRDLAIKIKRGVTPKNYKKVDKPWKRIDNIKLAQLSYAFFYQYPGIAKNSPRILFQQPEYYKKIFTPSNLDLDLNTLHDLVYLAYLYDEYKVEKNKLLKSDQKSDLSELSFTKISLYTVIAMIGYMIKVERGLVTSYLDSKINDYNINGDLFNEEMDPNNLRDIIFATFDFLINSIIVPTYNEYRRELNITSELNLLKSDTYYIEKILSKLDKELNSKFREETRLKIFSIFKC